MLCSVCVEQRLTKDNQFKLWKDRHQDKQGGKSGIHFLLQEFFILLAKQLRMNEEQHSVPNLYPCPSQLL